MRSFDENVPEAWVENHYPELCRFAGRLRRGDGTHLVHEAWISVISSRTTEHRDLRAYFRTAIRNRYNWELRMKKNRKHREESVARPEAVEQYPLEERERARKIRRAVDGLPEPYAHVICLRYFDNLSICAIAERLGISHSTVETRLYRAVRRLREGLDPEVQ